MEKKGSRSVQPSSKGSVTESKKSQDGTSGKLWPRYGRRRESASSSLASKNEASRKPVPQRNKNIDKRPRPRGYYYSGVAGGKEGAGLEEVDAELGSVFVQGSKKQSLNHLLNFHYAPREGQLHAGRAGVSNKSGHRWCTTLKHKYNKEHFLQANCQFIVNANGDYKAYLNNPDALVNWDLIEQVNVQVLDFPACPICLYHPVAAKMTRCGHIYCWPCILHYLSLSDKSWRKCPICFEDISKKELKSVIPIPHSVFNVNENITFKLMKRAKGCLTACFADVIIPDENKLFSMSEIDTQSVYSKLLVANKSEVMSFIERERNELKKQLLEEEDCPEKCFIEEALGLLQERESVLLSTLDDTAEKIKDELCSLNLNREKENSCHENCTMSDVVSEDLDNSSSTQLSKYYYFYQAQDGQHIYLHPLNVRMLEFMYGSLEASPHTLTGRIVEKEGGSMTEDLRKRLRYLQHLPVTCQFEVAEIQLKEPVVSKETLEHFNDQIESRKKKRQRRAREERRREKRIVEEENIKMGKFPAPNLHIESHQQFPEVGSDLNDERQRTESESKSDYDGLPSPSSSLASSLNNDYSGPSFAKMLASTKTRTTWPEVKPSTSNSKPIAITKTKSSNDSESESDFYPAPAFNQSFGDAIAIALEKASKDFAAGTDDEPVQIGSKKKKKKSKQKVLFATSMAYSGS